MAKLNNGSTFTVNASNKTVTGGNGVDVIRGSLITEITGNGWTISGGNGADIIEGSAYNDIIWGDTTGNTSTADNGADTLVGGGGNDEMHGGNGSDLLQGDAGADILYGDRGGDVFKYVKTSDSTATGLGAWSAATGDTIMDFKQSEGDLIDLAAVPLTGAAPNQKLTWSSTGGGQPFDVWFVQNTGSTGGFVYADTNGDGVADMAIKVASGIVGASSFIGVNHDPNAGAALTGSATEDAAAATFNLVSGATDSDGNAINVVGSSVTYSVNGGPASASAPTGVSLSGNTLTVDTTNNAFDSLAVGQTMTIKVAYTIADGFGGTATQTETITVTGVNDGPALTGTQSSLGNATEDVNTYTVTEAQLLAGFTDVDSDGSLDVANVTVSHGSVNDNGDGTYTVTWDANYNGSATFSYDVVDNHGATLAATLDLTVDAVEDEATGTLSVTGTAEEGGSLSATLAGAADVDGAIVSTDYQWQINDGSGWVDISGATSDALSIPSDQSYVGADVRVVVTTTDSVGGTTTFTSDASTVANVEDEATGTPTVTGTAEEGGSITASLAGAADEDGLASTSYQWQEFDGTNWVDIAGETSATLNFASDQSDVGKVVRAVITTTDDFSGTTTFTTDASTVQNVEDEATGTPTITGTAEEGGSITASLVGAADEDGLASTAYQWQEFDGTNWVDIAGETSATLSFASDQSDVGKVVRAVITTTDDFSGTTTFTTDASTVANVEDEATGTPTVTGTAEEGGSITASLVGAADEDGLASTAYQWQSFDGTNWADIAGETSATLSFASDQSDVGKVVRAVITTTDGFGGTTTFTTGSSTVANVEDEATGTPTIGGNVQEGFTATASLAGAADQDGAIVSTTYQWQLFDGTNWNNISGATNAAITFASDQSDVGKVVRAEIVTTDALGGTTTFHTSSATVLNFNDNPVILNPNGGSDVTMNYAENGTGSIATLSSTDEDGDTVTYTLSGADAAKFQIIGGVLSFVSSPDYETPTDSNGDNVYGVTVVANDGHGGTDTQNYAITVTNVNEVPVDTTNPTDIRFTLSTATGSVANQGTNTATGDVLGALNVTDTGSTAWTYSIVSVNGTAGATNFAVSSSSAAASVNLVVGAGGVTNDTNYDVVIRATDSGGNSYDEHFQINYGGSGNDTYAGFSVSDIFYGSNGNDTATGVGGDDVLVGGANTDNLNGGAGNDVLFGGGGGDTFTFTDFGAANADAILDFDASDTGGNQDVIALENSVFTALGVGTGALNAANFVSNTTGTAGDANDYIVYNSTTGQLYYDADGSGSGAAQLIATLTVAGGTVDASDFTII